MSEKKENSKQKDILGNYPKKEQVAAFPERRYIKLMRFLTIFSVINLAFTMVWCGIYFYMAKNVDISIQSATLPYIYVIDPEKKVLRPLELGRTNVSSLTLMVETAIRRYLKERYSSINNQEEMTIRWTKAEEINPKDGPEQRKHKEDNNAKKYVWLLSSPEVFETFRREAEANFTELFRKGDKRVRELYIHDLYLDHHHTWVAYIETFDFKVDENAQTPCSDIEDLREQLACKSRNAVSRKRQKIWLKAFFNNPKKSNRAENPLRVMIYAYYSAEIPILENDPEKYWDLPAILRPRI